MAAFAQSPASNPTLRIMSSEARAQLVADSIGKISDGDPRKRVYDAALVQIRNAVAVAMTAGIGSLEVPDEE